MQVKRIKLYLYYLTLQLKVASSRFETGRQSNNLTTSNVLTFHKTNNQSLSKVYKYFGQFLWAVFVSLALMISPDSFSMPLRVIAYWIYELGCAIAGGKVGMF